MGPFVGELCGPARLRPTHGTTPVAPPDLPRRRPHFPWRRRPGRAVRAGRPDPDACPRSARAVGPGVVFRAGRSSADSYRGRAADGDSTPLPGPLPSRSQGRALRARSAWSGVLIGVGIAAFVDETVFHQLLHWHHFYDRSTPEVGLVSDGLFHAFGWFAVVIGLFMVADLRHRAAPGGARPGRGHPDRPGAFQLYDGTVQHKLMKLHQIRYHVDLDAVRPDVEHPRRAVPRGGGAAAACSRPPSMAAELTAFGGGTTSTVAGSRAAPRSWRPEAR